MAKRAYTATLSAEDRIQQRGGVRQRAAKRNDETKLSESASDEYSKSILAFNLVQLVLWGQIPATLCQQIADWAIQDGIEHADVQALAELGTHARHPQHCYRDLLRRLKLPKLSQALHTVSFCTKTIFGVSKGIARKTILLPHLLFAQLYNQYPDLFMKRIVGGTVSNIASFWKSQSKHPSFANHPMRTHHRLKGNYTEKAIPIALHGGGVATTAVGKSYSKSVEGYSWQSCLVMGCTGPTLTIFLICIIFKTVLDAGPGAQAEIWLWMTWSLFWLYEGVHPTHAPNGSPYTTGIEAELAGEPLAGGFYCVLWQIRGDLEYMLLTLKLRNYNSNTPCSCCGANGSTHPWTDARRNAALWLDKLWTNASFAEAFPDRHPLFKLQGVGICNWCPDWLHTKALGTDAWFFGSVMEMLCSHMLPGNFQENLETIRTEIMEIYDMLKTKDRMPVLTKGMFHAAKGDKFPCMKGRGSCIKGLGPVLVKLFKRHMNDIKVGTKAVFNRMDVRQWVLWSLEIAVNLNTLLDEHNRSPSLPDDVAKEFEANAFRFCGLMTKIGDALHPHGVALFNYTIEFHYLLHISLIAQYQNPLLGSCSQGEQMMAVVKRLAASCSRNNNQHQVTNAAIEKYCNALAFEWLQSFDKDWLQE